MSGKIEIVREGVLAAEAIEQQSTPDDIVGAVIALKSAGKQPVPGLIQQQIERQNQQQKTAERLAHEDADRRAREKNELNPAAQAKGEEYLPPHLLARLPHKSQP